MAERKKAGIRGNGKKPGTKDESKLSKRLNRLFWQTVLSIVLFLVVFAGGGLLPGQNGDLYSAVNQLITRQDALLESVETLGHAVTHGGDWTQAVRDWCQETFLPAKVPAQQDDADIYLGQGTAYHSYLLPTMVAPDET